MAANGFAWPRFCLAWAAFVFVFFSASGSKLPSYILPLFPALALVLGLELTRMPARTLMWIALPLAIGAPVLLAGFGLGFDRVVDALSSDITPPSIYRQFGAWILAGLVAFSAGGVASFLLFRRGTAAAKTLGIAVLSLTTLAGMQLSLVGHDAFAHVRSAYYLLEDAKRAAGGALDPDAVVYQVKSYDQTLPFYLGRPTPLVDYRDEMSLGLELEPQKGFSEAQWIPVWTAAPQAYAMMEPAAAEALRARNVPLTIIARDPRRVFVARR